MNPENNAVTLSAPRILIVGAGAVGQVYGYFAQNAGADVSVFVRPKYQADALAGYTLYPFQSPRKSTLFKPKSVLTNWAEVSQQRFDQVYICTSSPALRIGKWVEEMSRAIGDALILLLTPGMEDRTYIQQWIPSKNVVTGLITVVSYHSPLPGQEGPSGVAYWYPPLAPSLFSSSADHTYRGKSPAATIAELLRAGGMKTKLVGDTVEDSLFAATTLNIAIAALEGQGWSFARLSQRQALEELTQAIQQGCEGVSRSKKIVLPLPIRAFFRPITWRTLFRLSPVVVPFPFETYLQAHFTKVGDQTLEMIKDYQDLCQKVGVQAPALRAVIERIQSLRGQSQGG